jgi:hypothetical protein
MAAVSRLRVGAVLLVALGLVGIGAPAQARDCESPPNPFAALMEAEQVLEVEIVADRSVGGPSRTLDVKVLRAWKGGSTKEDARVRAFRKAADNLRLGGTYIIFTRLTPLGPHTVHWCTKVVPGKELEDVLADLGPAPDIRDPARPFSPPAEKPAPARSRPPGACTPNCTAAPAPSTGWGRLAGLLAWLAGARRCGTNLGKRARAGGAP